MVGFWFNRRAPCEEITFEGWLPPKWEEAGEQVSILRGGCYTDVDPIVS